MIFELFVPLCVGILLIAMLYSSVGHAGASGYIAVMSLLSLAPEVIRPTALAMNILVGAIATFQFYRAGHFHWQSFWPFALLAVPFAYLGGNLTIPTTLFKILLGLVLLYAASRFLLPSKTTKTATPAPLPYAMTAGASIGLISGLTGTGGGIFLTPLLLLMGWAEAKRAAAVSAPFVLVNSVAGLAGYLAHTQTLPKVIVPLLLTAAIGGFIGAYLGSRKIQSTRIKQLLGLVLLIAGLKLIFT